MTHTSLRRVTSAEPADGRFSGQHLARGSWDDDSSNWVADLTSIGPSQDAAVARLHALLVRMARAEAARRTGWYDIRGPELDDLADQATGDAVVSILRRVADFREDGRFTTWACAFVIR